MYNKIHGGWGREMFENAFALSQKHTGGDAVYEGNRVLQKVKICLELSNHIFFPDGSIYPL